jgi:hypothetical protein
MTKSIMQDMHELGVNMMNLFEGILIRLFEPSI